MENSPEKSTPIDNIPPLAISEREYREIERALFEERFGGFDPTDPFHTRLRKKLQASIRISEEDNSMVFVGGEVAQLMRQWMIDHGC